MTDDDEPLARIATLPETKQPARATQPCRAEPEQSVRAAGVTAFYTHSMSTGRAHDEVLVHLRAARDHADRHFTEPLGLDQLAAIARLSKFHFQRLFTATYGLSPAAYLSQRRIERAQDLLRATNLSATEVCHAVGFSSLGSFSARFREVVGESPSAFQARYAASGAPHIPGCYVFMWGLVETASQEKRRDGDVS